ncbi:MAG: phosphate ABC transporter ATP-binding protein PstB [Trueperaceae bacterium]|nr:phosphate ABC transporter ATP-binding protein PstB [Trueperaceae bacterium]
MDPVTRPPTAPSTPKPQQAGQGEVRATIAADAEPRLVTEGITVHYGKTVGVRDVGLTFRDKTVTALIGPSGCGKTTFLRSLNRMHDLTRGVKVSGRALLDGTDVYANGVDPVTIRRRIGMVFQKPTPFPTMSIYDNVVAGLKLVGIRDRALLDDVAERSLRQAALWDEVKDRLKAPASGISGGQQQRLSIARALAVEAEVLLMDEPTSSLDPQSTMRIEELIQQLKDTVTIIIVTHNMQQAARVSDYTAFFYEGDLVEVSDTNTMFTNPKEQRTNDYITGRFG